MGGQSERIRVGDDVGDESPNGLGVGVPPKGDGLDVEEPKGGTPKVDGGPKGDGPPAPEPGVGDGVGV